MSRQDSQYNERMNHSRQRELVAQRTKEELHASHKITLAYVAEIPAKSANSVLQAVEYVIRDRDAVNLRHLRRFVKSEHVPCTLTQVTKISTCESYETTTESPSSVDVPGTLITPRQSTLHFLICATSMLPFERVLESLSSLEVFKTRGSQPKVRTIPIPLLPPTSEEQAQQWSKDYWPTVYNKNNPFGPHPSVISRTEEEIRSSVGVWMELARLAGSEVSVARKGEPVGAVIVHRNASVGAAPIVAAGDARWNGAGQPARGGGGNAMGHAVMRAIGLVAQKRRDSNVAELLDANKPDCSDSFADKPLTELENTIYLEDNLAPGGYLCLDLELYVTHEPCVMCSMAVLHSRFGKVIFGKRLPRTGGMSAVVGSTDGNSKSEKPELAYGLFWRPELNWKLLAWQWIDDESPLKQLSDINTHA